MKAYEPALARVALPTILVLVIIGVYWPTLTQGFVWDDYHLFRPWTSGELHAVWTGSWDPIGNPSFAVFYRPLAAWWYATAFWAFGVNAAALHGLSLAMHACCAGLLWVWLRREGTSPAASAAGALLYACHPALVSAQVAWLTNQMHALGSIAALATLLWWQYSRDRPLWTWTLPAATAFLAFLIKEDAVVLLPLLVVLTALRRGSAGLGMSGRRLMVLGSASLAFAFALSVLRYLALGGMGGYPSTPQSPGALMNFERGLWFGIQGPGPWAHVQSGITIIGLGATGMFLAGRRRGIDATALRLMRTGVVALLVLNVPFVLVSKPEQYHLLALSSCVVFAGVTEALLAHARCNARWLYAGIGAALLVAAATSAVLLGRYAPCSADTRFTDRSVVRWASVPDAITDWVARKQGACEAGAQAAAFPPETPLVWRIASASTAVSLLPTPNGHYLEMRSASGEPTEVDIITDTTRSRLIVAGPSWRRIPLSDASTVLTALRQAHRVDIQVRSAAQFETLLLRWTPR